MFLRESDAMTGVGSSGRVWPYDGCTLPGWWNGRHGGLKSLCSQGRAGSSPAPGTARLDTASFEEGVGVSFFTDRGVRAVSGKDMKVIF